MWKRIDRLKRLLPAALTGSRWHGWSPWWTGANTSGDKPPWASKSLIGDWGKTAGCRSPTAIPMTKRSGRAASDGAGWSGRARQFTGGDYGKARLVMDAGCRNSHQYDWHGDGGLGARNGSGED